MDDLVTWLLAQVAEEERDARNMAALYPSPWDLSDRGASAYVTADAPHFRKVIRLDQEQAHGHDGWLGSVIEHVARWHPDRVLAECDAKRRLVSAVQRRTQGHPGPHINHDDQDPPDYSEYDSCSRCIDWNKTTLDPYALLLLALPYTGRSGYREEWRP